jgi:hypothetical protein
MCFQIVERYSLCGRVFQEHGIDECPLYQQKGHAVQLRVVLIGTLCPRCMYRRQVPERGIFNSEMRSEKLHHHRKLVEDAMFTNDLRLKRTHNKKDEEHDSKKSCKVSTLL